MKEVRVKKEETAKREEMKEGKRRQGEEGNEKVKRKKSK